MRTSVAGLLAVAGRASVLSGVVLTFILTTILGECVGGWELFKSSFVSPKLQFPASTVRKTITVSIFLCPLWGWETTMNGKGLLSYRQKELRPCLYSSMKNTLINTSFQSTGWTGIVESVLGGCWGRTSESFQVVGPQSLQAKVAFFSCPVTTGFHIS